MVKSELLLRSNLNFSSSETTIYIASENPLIKVTWSFQNTSQQKILMGKISQRNYDCNVYFVFGWLIKAEISLVGM